MAITKISGEILESNLIRNTDLAFNGQLLYLDVQNGRIGVNTNSPGQTVTHEYQEHKQSPAT